MLELAEQKDPQLIGNHKEEEARLHKKGCIK